MALALSGCVLPISLDTQSESQPPTAGQSSTYAHERESKPSADASSTQLQAPAQLTEAELLARAPAEAQVDNLKGAMAFARYFLDELNQMYVAMDPQVVDWLATDECGFCASHQQTIGTLQSLDSTKVGGMVTVNTDYTRGRRYEDGTWDIEFDAMVAEATMVTSQGSVLAEEETWQGKVSVHVDWIDGRWQVLGVDAQSY